MRANKKYLLDYIDSEIKMETKKIWNEEVAEIRAEHDKIQAMKEADKARDERKWNRFSQPKRISLKTKRLQRMKYIPQQDQNCGLEMHLQSDGKSSC